MNLKQPVLHLLLFLHKLCAPIYMLTNICILFLFTFLETHFLTYYLIPHSFHNKFSLVRNSCYFLKMLLFFIFVASGCLLAGCSKTYKMSLIFPPSLSFSSFLLFSIVEIKLPGKNDSWQSLFCNPLLSIRLSQSLSFLLHRFQLRIFGQLPLDFTKK